MNTYSQGQQAQFLPLQASQQAVLQTQAAPQAAQAAQAVAQVAATTRQLCFNTQTDQVCLRVTPLGAVQQAGDVLQSQGILGQLLGTAIGGSLGGTTGAQLGANIGNVLPF